MQKRPNPQVLEWFLGLADDEIFLSVLTIGEIRRRIRRLQARDSRQASALNSWLTQLTTGYENRILAVDRSVAQEWGSLPMHDAVPVIDGLIGATQPVSMV